MSLERLIEEAMRRVIETMGIASEAKLDSKSNAIQKVGKVKPEGDGVRVGADGVAGVFAQSVHVEKESGVHVVF